MVSTPTGCRSLADVRTGCIALKVPGPRRARSGPAPRFARGPATRPPAPGSSPSSGRGDSPISGRSSRTASASPGSPPSRQSWPPRRPSRRLAPCSRSTARSSRCRAGAAPTAARRRRRSWSTSWPRSASSCPRPGSPVVVDPGTPEVDSNAVVVQGTFLVGRTPGRGRLADRRALPARPVRAGPGPVTAAPPRSGRRPRPRPLPQDRRGPAVPRGSAAVGGAARPRPRGHAQRRADGLDGRLVPPPAAVGRRGPGRPPDRRRRVRVRRLQHRRPVDVLRLRARAGRAGRRRADGARQPVPAPRRGRDRRVGAARRPLRPAEVAVHELRDPRQHRGDPRRAGGDRTRAGAAVRRQVPRPLRRDAGRARRRRPARHRGARRAREHRRGHGRRPVQRPGGAGPSPRATRRRDRPDRARDHEQRRPGPARRRASTPSCVA